MTISRRVLPALLLAATVAAPSIRAADKAETAERARSVLRAYCRKCHAGPADQLKGDLPVFDYEALLRRKVVRPGKPAESELFQLVDCGSMPPGDLPKPGPAEAQTLHDWIADGAPDFPPESGEIYVLKKIQNDLATLNAKDMKYQRYISFNHLLAADPGGDPTLWRDALLKALNHLTWAPTPAAVTPIDPPANTIFRLDERQLGWDAQPFEAADPKDPNAAASASHVDLFDLLLLEYPYATLPSRFGGDQKALADFLRGANPVRPILYVRGDWLVSTATQPPLYLEDLLGLPRAPTRKDRADDKDKRDGLEEKIAAGAQPAWAAFLDSRVSKLPQLVARRTAAAGAYWRTFDPGTARDLRGVVRGAASDAPRGGLMLFSLPNGLNGYYIAESVTNDDKGRRVLRLAPAAPKEWVTDPVAPDQVARNGLSCMRCHETGVATFTDAARSALEGLPSAEKDPLSLLFPGKEAIDQLLAADAARFRNAVQAIHGGPLDREPLTPVTRRFLEGRRTAPVVPAVRTGGADPSPTPAAGDGGSWDLARAFGKDLDAPPLPPLDGLTAPQYEPPLPPVDVTLTAVNVNTKQETTTFFPGEHLAVEVTNRGKKDVYFELIGAYMDGHVSVHQPPRTLGPGETYSFPRDRPKEPKGKPQNSIEMGLPPGVDRYILFAADAEFPAGVRLRVKDKDKEIADRVVHPFWAISANGDAAVPSIDPSHLVKKTVFVETRER